MRSSSPIKPIYQYLPLPSNVVIAVAVFILTFGLVIAHNITSTGGDVSSELVFDNTQKQLVVSRGTLGKTEQAAPVTEEGIEYKADESSGSIVDSFDAVAWNDDRAPRIAESSEDVPSEGVIDITLIGEKETASNEAGLPQEDADNAITGKIIADSGEPLQGALVQGSLKKLLDSDDAYKQGSTSAGQRVYYVRKTATTEDGAYHLGDLAPGEYRVKAVSDGYLPAAVVVRSGESGVNLALSTPVSLSIQGVISNQSGLPLEGVEVKPNTSDSTPVISDADGRYLAKIELSGERAPDSLLVRYKTEGYRENLERLNLGKLTKTKVINHDIVMAPLNDVASVAGSVIGANNMPVPAATVLLHSPGVRARYVSQTDSTGTFMIENVDTAADYRLTVRTREQYKDYLYRPLAIFADQHALNVVLEPLASTRISGQMVDALGRPVPGYTLRLRGVRAAGHTIHVTGDSQGLFSADNAPLDGLVFESASYPQHRISNISTAAGEAFIRLVIDRGDQRIQGQILSAAGEPVPVPVVTLSWLHTDRGIRSVSTRRTATDSQGKFNFSRLGPGLHTISIRAPGFRHYQAGIDVSKLSELKIMLDRS